MAASRTSPPCRPAASRAGSRACSSSPARRTPPPRVATAQAIDAALDAAGIAAPRVHHGFGLATWDVLRRAKALGHGWRVGFEDTLVLPDGRPAASNAELVSAALAL